MNEKIKVQNLMKSLEGKTILSGINVTILKGEIFTIVGPSGAGKSMFLRALNRLTEPEAGDILLDGVSLFSLNPRELRRKVGMVFQVPVLFPGTVRENIRTGPVMWDEEDRSRAGIETTPDDVTTILESVALSPDFADRDAGNLSVGEQQRVCIARALANDPQVLLMDEPTASLDPTSTRKIESLITTLNLDRGLTFVVVTHNMDQARRIGHTTMLLEAGEVKEVLPTIEFFSVPRAGFQTTCCRRTNNDHHDTHDHTKISEGGRGDDCHGAGEVRGKEEERVDDGDEVGRVRGEEEEYA